MRLLLDTHVFLWWLLADARLSPSATAALTDSANQLFLSSASGFEIATKTALGKLKLPSDVRTFVTAGMRQGQVTELSVTLEHTYPLDRLPHHHRDPFDRLLIAQAQTEGMSLLTDDAEIRRYNVPIVW